MEGFQGGRVRRRQVGDAVVGNDDHARHAAFLAVAVQRLGQLARRGDRLADGAGDLLPGDVAAQGLDVFPFAHAQVA